jgi:hypothetical protein
MSAENGSFTNLSVSKRKKWKLHLYGLFVVCFHFPVPNSKYSLILNFDISTVFSHDDIRSKAFDFTCRNYQKNMLHYIRIYCHRFEKRNMLPPKRKEKRDNLIRKRTRPNPSRTRTQTDRSDSDTDRPKGPSTPTIYKFFSPHGKLGFFSSSYNARKKEKG